MGIFLFAYPIARRGMKPPALVGKSHRIQTSMCGAHTIAMKMAANG
jgi:hypothetical protein